MKDRIISLMKHMGMSQKVFASEICISEGALSSIFSGRTKPTLNTINNIHERFPEVNIGWLMDGKGEMFSSATSVSMPAEMNGVTPPASALQAVGIPVQSDFMDQLAVSHHMVASQTSLSSQEKKILDKPVRRIAEIRVFYDDGTFETFPGKV